jgi:DNA-binding Lrp family transcriptional regulator
VPQSRKKPSRAAKRVSATRTPARPPKAPVLSLPPAHADSAQPLPDATAVPETGMTAPKPGVHTTLPKNSVVRQKALAIMAMRLAGHSNEEIAKDLGLSERSLNQYLYMAGKRGWIPRKKGFVDPKDEIEFSLAHKVVRNLSEAMDDDTRNEKTGMPVKTEVALEVAKGTIFKKFSDAGQAAPPTNVLAIRIEMPPGPPQEIREGTTGGRGRWIEATVVEDAS